MLLNKALGKGNARVKAFVLPHLQHQAALPHCIPQRQALIHAHTQRLLHQHMFTGRNGLLRQHHVKLIGHADDHRFHMGIGQHIGIIGVGHLRLVDGGHAPQQVCRHVADGVQLSIARFAARLKMGGLGNGSGAQHANTK